MRADFYSQWPQDEASIKLLSDGHFPVGVPGQAALEKMIVGPASAAGLNFQPPKLVQRILDDTGTAPGALALVGPVGRIPAQQLGFASSRRGVLPRVVAVGACLGVIGAAAVLFAGHPLPPRPGALFEPAWLGSGLHFATLVILPAFFEEVFFRGGLQRFLSAHLGPPPAIGVCAILFALLHAAPQGILFAFSMGICLGALAYWSGSIYEVMLVHAINNTAVFVSQMT